MIKKETGHLLTKKRLVLENIQIIKPVGILDLRVDIYADTIEPLQIKGMR